MIEDWIDRIHVGDSLLLLEEMPSDSVNLVICSPPYYKQRQYTEDPREVGREKTVKEYLDTLHELFKECVRVIRPDGSVVFNLGDKYLDGNLMLIPFQFALLAQRCNSATLINELTWIKQNPTPRQYDRRLVSATEPFFHFVKTSGYKYFMECVSGRADTKARPNTKVGQRYYMQIEESDLSPEQKERARKELAEVIEEVKVGKIADLRMKIKGKHSKPFGGQGGGRMTQINNKGYTIIRLPGNSMEQDWMCCPVENIKGGKHPAIYPRQIVEYFLDLTTEPGDIVLDPFMGSGTTAIVCKGMGRRYIGLELNEEYAAEARRRLSDPNHPAVDERVERPAGAGHARGPSCNPEWEVGPDRPDAGGSHRGLRTAHDDTAGADRPTRPGGGGPHRPRRPGRRRPSGADPSASW